MSQTFAQLINGKSATVEFSTGSASTPSVAFSGDTNTGIYSPGADQVAISTAGSGRLFVDSSGIVDIRSTAPVLNIVDTDTARAGAVNSFIAFRGSDDQKAYIGCPGTGDTRIWGRTADPILFGTNDTERLRITSTGLVGVGSSTPGSYDAFADDLVIANGSGNPGITLAGSTTGWGSIYFADGTTGSEPYRGYIQYGHTNDRMTFATAGSGAMHIDSSQRVGIGTTSPSRLLHLSAADSTAYSTSDFDQTYNFLRIVNTTGTKATGIYLGSGSTGEAAISAVETSAGSTSLTFGTRGGGSRAERMRLDESGRLLVGTSSPYADSSELFEVFKANGPNNGWVSTPNLANDDSVSWRALGGVSSASLRQSGIGVYKHSGIATPCGFLYMQAQNADTLYYWTDNSSNFRISTLASNIGTTGGTVVGTQTSDERIKNILGPVEYGLNTVKQIEPVRYSLKSEPDVEKLGFIAQQIQPLIPQSVFDTNEHIEGEPEDAPTKLGMEYVSLIPVLVNAIKELSAEVDALKSQLQAQ